MTRRSQMEIYMDILEAVANGRQKPTHIMCRANLCWERLKGLLRFLVEEGILDKANVDRSVIFSLTSKGRNALGYYKKIEGEIYPKKKILSEVYIHHK